jgi:hypothetical protein
MTLYFFKYFWYQRRKCFENGSDKIRVFNEFSKSSTKWNIVSTLVNIYRMAITSLNTRKWNGKYLLIFRQVSCALSRRPTPSTDGISIRYSSTLSTVFYRYGSAHNTAGSTPSRKLSRACVYPSVCPCKGYSSTAPDWPVWLRLVREEKRLGKGRGRSLALLPLRSTWYGLGKKRRASLCPATDSSGYTARGWDIREQIGGHVN